MEMDSDESGKSESEYYCTIQLKKPSTKQCDSYHIHFSCLFFPIWKIEFQKKIKKLFTVLGQFV